MNKQNIALALLVTGIALSIGRWQMGGSHNDSTVNVEVEDQEMNSAIQKAQETLPDFIRSLQSPAPGDRYMLVKASFVAGPTAEHIWVADPSLGTNGLTGVIANEPAMEGLRFKQQVTIKLDQVSDWMIVQNRRVEGAFTTRVLRKRMDPEERKALDETLPYKFD